MMECPDGKTDIRSCLPNELEDLAVRLGVRAYRGRQVFQWIHKRHVDSMDEMDNIGTSFQNMLATVGYLTRLSELDRQVSADRTTKYLFGLADGEGIESVLMWYRYGASICVSSQVGCQMGCSFCASTIGGLVRNLTAGEMAAQVSRIHRMDIPADQRVHSIVIMGSGEPLDNYVQVLRFLRIMNQEAGLGISYRRMTISTCGLVPGILRLADEGIPVNLSVSLHGPNDQVRTQIMPVNQRYPIAELMNACRVFIQKTNRRITFEYALIRGVNDQREHASELGLLLKTMLSHVNLIPLNPVKERPWQKSDDVTIRDFASVLQRMGVETTIRRELGQDIDAACGQLRQRQQRQQRSQD